MKSALAVSYKIHEPILLAADLAAQIHERMPPVANRCGIVLGEPCCDWDVFLPELSRLLKMDVVGCTGSAQMSSYGVHTLSATLLVLGDDDCFFSTALAENLSVNPEQKISDAYASARAGLDAEECKAVFVFSSQPATAITDSALLDLLSRCAGNTPIFGGAAADYLDFSNARVFYNGYASNDSAVLLLLGGAVRPKFIMRSIYSNRMLTSCVTAARGTIIESIDDICAYEFMRSQGADMDGGPRAHFYTPLVLGLDEAVYPEDFVCRTVSGFTPHSGNGHTKREVPQGTPVCVQSVQASDVVSTSRDAISAMRRVIEEAAEEGYSYSVVLGISCTARHVLLASGYEYEGAAAKELLAPLVTFAGFYAYGEFCPHVSDQGKVKNRLHELSIGLCAL